ncbi:LysM peptidoglycan-binding domain-containing protein [Virgibacillus sp. L01]|uniref:LysM peptidoglycan-binding domain-containing protein n=1 Tax=Virgibacillus sp. L01 TaxID=3457429 RepID=UPI003FD03172
MKNLMKILSYILIALFFISIYKDLSVGTTLTPENNIKQPQVENMVKTENITAMEVKVHQGDTLLTIAEKINPQVTNNLNVNKIVEDFKALNPTTDPVELQPGEFYFFPIYEKEAG